MDASLNSHCDFGSMDTYSPASKCESVLTCLAKLVSPLRAAPNLKRLRQSTPGSPEHWCCPRSHSKLTQYPSGVRKPQQNRYEICGLEPISSGKSPPRSLGPPVVPRQASRPPCQNQDEISELRTIEPSGILVSFSFETPTSEQAEVQALIFEEKDFSLLVVDQPLQDQSLLEMMQKTSCVAGINGGYFQPDGTPLGLLVHYGKMIHPQQRGSILSGFFVSSPEKMTILRLGEEIPASAREVLQAGPFLLDHARPVIGLESTKKACRSFLATSDQGMWVMGIISPVTLDQASHILDALSGVLSEEKKEKKLTRALNLDGGSSSSFWAKTTLVPFSFRSDVCVRNYLGVKEKKSSQ